MDDLEARRGRFYGEKEFGYIWTRLVFRETWIFLFFFFFFFILEKFLLLNIRVSLSNLVSLFLFIYYKIGELKISLRDKREKFLSNL